MLISILNPTGEIPRLRSTQLPNNAAQLAEDCEFRHGVLTGLRKSTTVSAISSAIKSLFVFTDAKHPDTGAPMGDFKYGWSTDVDVVRSPIVNDKYNRFYWSDGTNFWVSQGHLGGGYSPPASNNKYKVGVPAPGALGTLMEATSKVFDFPNKTFIVVDVFDKYSNGDVENQLQLHHGEGFGDPTLGVTMERTAIGVTWTRQGRAPAQVKTTATVTTTTAPTTTAGKIYQSDANGNLITDINTGLPIEVTTPSDSDGNVISNLLADVASESTTVTAAIKLTTGGPFVVNGLDADFVVVNDAGSTSNTTVTSMMNGSAFSDIESSLYQNVSGVNDGTKNKYKVFYRLSGVAGGAWPEELSCSYMQGATERTFKIYRINKKVPAKNAATWYCSSKSVKVAQMGSGKVTTTKYPVVGAIARIRLSKTNGVYKFIDIGDRAELTAIPSDMPGYEGSLTFTPSEGDATTGEWKFHIGYSGQIAENRGYVYTYVNDFGEEGPPSPVVDVSTGDAGEVTLNVPPPPTDYVPIHYVRVYRTASGTTTEFMYLDNPDDEKGWPISTTAISIVDNGDISKLGESLSTTNMYPPAQDLRGLCVMANGMVAGFRENEVHIMEPWLPYACNPNYIKPFKSKVTGICPYENGLYVTTEANPYLLMGTSPDNMTDAIVPAIQAGVSKGSIINMGSYVAYASNDGIVTARGLDATLDTSFRLFTRDTWKDKMAGKLSQVNLSAHNGAMLIWFDDGSDGYVLRMDEDAGSFVRHSLNVTAAYVNPDEDALYVAADGAVYNFGAAAGQSAFTWQSKDFVLPRPHNFGVLQVQGSGQVTVFVYCDGAQVHTEAVTLSGFTNMRLPSGFTGVKWSVKFVGAENSEVLAAHLATTITELQNV